MKKKLISLLLIVCMALGVCVSGCNNGSNNSSNNGNNSNENNGGNSNENNKDEEIANADLLALSYDRLENADLSFNFSMNKSVDTEKSAANTHSAKSKTNRRSGEGNYETYEITPSVYDNFVLEKYDYFKDRQDMLTRVRQEARAIADYAVDNITVMNTIVKGNTNYIMDYQSDSDVLTVSAFTYGYGSNGIPAEKIDTFKQIKIYYDNDGDETVEMWSYNEHTSGENTVRQVERIIYTANKFYYIANNTYGDWGANGEISGTYNLSVAYKSEDGWRGIQTYFNSENPYLTKEGTYDYANGLIHLNFLIEHDGLVYTFTDRLVAFRDGHETGSGVEASKDDEIRIQQYNVYSPSGIALTFPYNLFTIRLTSLEGWESVTFNGYYDRDVCYEYAFDSDDDVMIFSNGTSITYNSVWTKDTGWLSNNNGDYFDSNNNTIEWSDINWDEAFTVEAHADVYFNNGIPNAPYNAELYLKFDNSNATDSEQVALINDLFQSNGLSIKGDYESDPIESLVYLQANKKKFTDELFEYLFNKEYTETQIKSVYDLIMSELDGFEESIDSYVDGFESVKFDEQPKKPSSIGLVALSDKISGKVKVTEAGLDFSDVTVTVNKSTILSNGQNYGIVVGWSNGSGTVFTDAFNTEVYAHENMSFTGKGNLPLPATKNGEYTLKAFFGKITDESTVRLSEITSIPVEKFETFETRVTVEGGYNLHTFFTENGDTKLNVTFVDTEPPAVTVNDGEAVGDKIILTLPSGATVSELLSKIEATDNVDGYIALDVSNVSADAELSIDDLLCNGGIYTVTVSDSAGNKRIVIIRTDITQPETNE